MDAREEAWERTALLIGEEGVQKLRQSRVLLFGLGGVGGYAAEALARCGIGTMTLVDADVICPSNLNRQILATQETLGRYKADVCRERVLSINPKADVRACRLFYLPQTADAFDFTDYDYVIDAVDTVTAKLLIIKRAKAADTPVISSMGAGNKLYPSKLAVADLYETSVCPLARVMRRECRKLGIESLKVVYSTEPPFDPAGGEEEDPLRNSPLRPSEAADRKAEDPLDRPDVPAGGGAAESGHRKKVTPGSICFVPAAAGLLLAAEVTADLLRQGEEGKR